MKKKEIHPSSDQKSFWNRAANTKRFSHAIDFDEFDKHVDIESVILDYGCGYGRTLSQLKQLAYSNIVGMDFSERMVETAKGNLPGVPVVQCEAGQVPAEEDCFDAILLFSVLTCVHRDEDQKRLIAELGRVLKPGGVLYISDFLLNSDARNQERYEKFKDKYDRYGVFELEDGAVLRHHSAQWIDELTAPFIILHFRTFVADTMNGHQSNAFQTIVRK
jgi:SAM-dependent methyltransferase